MKSEIRNPKSEGIPKPEFRKAAAAVRISVFGIRICFGFRISDFGIL
jgi:hypothetical protein